MRSFVLHSVRAQDAKEAIIYVGSKESMDEFERGLPAETLAGYKVVAHYEPAEGTLEDFSSMLKEESVGRVVFAPKHTEFGELARATCQQQELEGDGRAHQAECSYGE